MITITWQKSTADFTDDVAMNTSLAFSPAGQPAIAYLQAATHELKIAQLNDDGSWAITTVDTGLSGAGYPSLRFRFRQPAISYKVGKVVRYALSRGSSWTIVDVDQEGGASSLAFGPSRQATISYEPPTTLRLARAGDNIHTWVSGSVGRRGHEVTHANFNSLAFTPSGQPAIAYYDSHNEEIRYAVLYKNRQQDPETWHIQTVDDLNSAGSGPSGWCSLRFSPSGQPAISYNAGNHLKYVVGGDEKGKNWTAELVSQGGYGSRDALGFTPSGEPAITFSDHQAGTVSYAMRSTNWTHFLVDQSGKNQAGQQVGPYALPTLVFSPTGQPAISYYDRTSGAINYAIGTVSQMLRDIIGSSPLGPHVR